MSKRITKIKSYILDQVYEHEDAIKFLIHHSSKSFIESIDISIHLGIDPRRSDHAIKSFVSLPHGTGKVKKVIVFTDNFTLQDLPYAYKVGGKSLIDNVAQSDVIDFDIAAASPDIMDQVSVLKDKLGRRGLMPSNKTGTISMNLDKRVKDLISNILVFKSDNAAIVNSSVGKCNFNVLHIIENIKTFLTAVKDSRPSDFKGVFIQKLYISSTMGPRFLIPLNQFNI